MKFEVHGNCNSILHMDGEVPSEFLDKFLGLDEGIHLYICGYKTSRGVLWRSLQAASEIRLGFFTPGIYDNHILLDLHKKNEEDLGGSCCGSCVGRMPNCS